MVVNHTLVNQSSVLVNTLANLIRQVAGGTPGQQMGRAYFSVDPLAADKGKNPQEEPPPSSQSATADPFGATAGKWATVYSSSSDEWLSFEPPVLPPERSQQAPSAHGGHQQLVPILHAQDYQQALARHQLGGEQGAYPNM
jgi:hypothetical protein